jgi:integrase
LTECNAERRLYYELLWETGGSQSDVVNLTSDNIDWSHRILWFHRAKLRPDAEPARITIGPRLEALLRQLPKQGPLFPYWSQTTPNDRAAEFRRRCRILKFEGVSLHCYRYAWAERAFEHGYPERYAQAALGHSSKAVHQAYAKGAKVICPSLEEYEKKVIPLPMAKAKPAPEGLLRETTTHTG